MGAHSMFMVISAVLAGLLLAGCTANPVDLAQIRPSAGLPAAEGLRGSEGGSAAQPSILTLEEVARHNSSSDCWMVIDGNVADLTSYVTHPAGDEFKNYCGTDASEIYHGANRSHRHSRYADSVLDSYIIGKLGQPLDAAGREG